MQHIRTQSAKTPTRFQTKCCIETDPKVLFQGGLMMFQRQMSMQVIWLILQAAERCKNNSSSSSFDTFSGSYTVD